MSTNKIKEVTELKARQVTLHCPICRNEEDGFMCDPRGQKFTCEQCGNEYKVNNDADIELW